MTDKKTHSLDRIRALAETAPDALTLEVLQDLMVLTDDQDQRIADTAEWAIYRLAPFAAPFRELFIQNIKDGYGKARTCSINAIALLGAAAADAAPALLSSLLRGEPGTLGRITEALREIAPENLPAACLHLERIYHQGQTLERQAVLKAAAGLAPVCMEAVPLVRNALRDTDVLVREQAYCALAAFAGQERQLLPLVLKGLKDEAPKVRVCAAWALGQLHPESDGAITDLIGLLADPEPEVVTTAVMALGAFGPRAQAATPALLGLLGTSEPERMRAVLGAFDHLGSEGQQQAVAVLAQRLGKAGPSLRQMICESLAFFQPETKTPLVPNLLALLAQGSELERMAAAYALNGVPPVGQVLPALGAALSDPSMQVRYPAALGLGGFEQNGVPAIPYLMKAFATSDEQVQTVILETLGRMGNGAVVAIPALIENFPRLTEAPLPYLQEFFYKLGEPGFSPLRQALDSPMERIRYFAVRLLPDAGANQLWLVKDTLTAKGLQDPSLLVRTAAQEALRRLAQIANPV